jgi:hypothetical protein
MIQNKLDFNNFKKLLIILLLPTYYKIVKDISNLINWGVYLWLFEYIIMKIKYTCYIFNFNINWFNIILFIYLKYMTKVKKIIKGIVRTINDDTYLKSKPFVARCRGVLSYF